MKYKFLDVGCKKGSSFPIAESYGYKREEGLGIDINIKHIEDAKAKGLNVEYGDITKRLNYPDGSFELVVSSHVMEHLPGRDAFLFALEEMLRLSSKYVMIAFPVFDHDEYLNSLGLKTFYSSWTGHKCMFHLSELRKILEKYSQDLRMIKLLKDSSAIEIHPLDSPKDQHDYDPKIHPPKPFVEFDRPIYREFQLMIKK